MAVRYDKNFTNEINKIVNSYNRKINRLSKAGGYILPDKFTAASLKNLKATATTRSEVRRKLKDLQSFTVRGGEKMIRVGKTTMPKYQYTNIKRYRRILNAQITNKMRKYETTHPVTGIKTEPLTFSQSGSQEYLTLKAKKMTLIEKDFKEMTQDEALAYLNKLMKNVEPKRQDVWQQNYLDILKDTALSYGYDPDKLDYIISRLELLTPREFDDLSFVSRNLKAVMYAYKAIENIETIKELTDVGDDVISNLDSIYENIDDMIRIYV